MPIFPGRQPGFEELAGRRPWSLDAGSSSGDEARAGADSICNGVNGGVLSGDNICRELRLLSEILSDVNTATGHHMTYRVEGTGLAAIAAGARDLKVLRDDARSRLRTISRPKVTLSRCLHQAISTATIEKG